MLYEKYLAKVSVRAGDNYCIRLPKRLVSSGNCVVGDELEVTIKRVDVEGKEGEKDDRKSNQEEGECSPSNGIKDESIREGEEGSELPKAESVGSEYQNT